MYVGGSIVILGIAMGCALDWALLLLVPSLPLVHYGTSLREERYLETEVWRRIPALQEEGSTLLVAILGSPLNFFHHEHASDFRPMSEILEIYLRIDVRAGNGTNGLLTTFGSSG
jgi:hypothetical protein